VSSYSTSAGFSFRANEPATFACALDSAPYAACSSPTTYAGLALGPHSFWFRWTAPATGAIAFDTAGSAFDTVLAVYRGTSVSALTAVAWNNDASASTRTSRVKFNASAGSTYVIAVDGASAAAGAVTLNWR
jgi:pre-peptidase